MVNIMASEITGTLTASPVKIQHHLDHSRVENQPDQTGSGSTVGLSGRIEKSNDIQTLSKELTREEDLPLTPLQKKAEESKDTDKLTDKVSKLNDYAQSVNREIQFSIHKETDQTVVKVIDSETEKVIRQMPSEQVLKIAESMENFSGMLLKEQA